MWRAGSPILRCHDSRFGATEFNARRDVSLRFRPFTSRGRTVPTLYGSDELTGALSETLFHLAPPGGGARRVRFTRLVPYVTSTLAPRRDLRLVDLRDVALTSSRYGLTRADLVESPAAVYPDTARWASAYFHSAAAPDGLVWNARQDRGALALVLFGRGRVDRRDLVVVEAPLPLAAGDGYLRALEAADRMGVTIVH